MTNEYVTTRNDNGDLAIRTVSATGDNMPADNSSVYTPGGLMINERGI